MIETLHIKNFQVFEDIEIKGLRRVNLIAGKNNAGKTAMLEALRLLEADAESLITVLSHILKMRGHNRQIVGKAFESIFNRKYLSISNSVEDMILQINDFTLRKKKDRTVMNFTLKNQVQGEIHTASDVALLEETTIFLPFGADLTNTKELWGKISLTPKEDDVIEIIKETVEPRIIRFDFSTDPIKVRLKEEAYPVPLQTLGDGVQRILTLAIALVSAKGKMLLIDEFEAGLHHSVQKRLWEMVFEYAAKWDIQVFATTHSQDTVRNFFYVASRPEYEKEATYMRLQFDRQGVHEAIVYDMERLEKSLELHLETR